MSGPEDDAPQDAGEAAPIVFEDGPDFDPMEPPIDLLHYEERSIRESEEPGEWITRGRE